MRYAAIYAFFLEGLAAASHCLKTFIEKAAQASLIGDVFDDAATGQGLLNFFLRGISCGAITEEEAMVTGLTIEELRSRSFIKILNARRGIKPAADVMPVEKAALWRGNNRAKVSAAKSQRIR